MFFSLLLARLSHVGRQHSTNVYQWKEKAKKNERFVYREFSKRVFSSGWKKRSGEDHQQVAHLWIYLRQAFLIFIRHETFHPFIIDGEKTTDFLSSSSAEA